MIVVGVLARLSSDFGLQFGEYTVFQHETQLYPRLKSNGAVNSQGYFDLDNMFINGLPDDYHLQFSLKLPSGVPPSIQLASPASNPETWGLAYYVYTYVTPASAVEEMLGKQPANHMYWSKLPIGKKTSKVFLSFSKLNINDPLKLTNFPTKVEAVKTSFLSDEPSLHTSATLDKPAYQYGDTIGIHVKINNPKRIKISGIRVNVKQLVAIKVGGDPKNVIKTCIGRFSFSHDRDELLALDHGFHQTVGSLRDVEMFSETLKVKPYLDPMRYLYQLALESRIPKSEQSSPILAPTMTFDGCSWPLGGGLDRLKILSVDYYINVHLVIPWSNNLIVKLPFKLVNTAGQIVDYQLNHMSESLNAPIFAASNSALPRIPEPYQGHENENDNIMEDLKDLRPAPPTRNLLHLIGDDLSSVSVSPTFDDKISAALMKQVKQKPTRQYPTVCSLKDDVLQAKNSLLQLREQLSDEQRLVLNNGLDANSLIIRFDPRRLVLVKEFLLVLEEVVMVWLPQISQKAGALSSVKSFENLTLFDPLESNTRKAAESIENDDENITARCLVQNVVGRLGMFHSQLVHFLAPKSVQEAKLESLNNLVDDVELMLSKLNNGLHGKLDDAGRRMSPELIRELILRIQRKSLDLVTAIPFYDRFEEELFRLKSKLACFGYLEEGELATNLVQEWSPEFDTIAVQLAVKFEALGALMASSSVSGTALSVLFADYIDSVIKIIMAIPSLLDRAGISVFWHWQYLFTIIDVYYCDGCENTMILPEFRQNINWSHRIKSLIPTQWDLLSADFNRLQLVGNRVIVAMQQLVDAKNEQ